MSTTIASSVQNPEITVEVPASVLHDILTQLGRMSEQLAELRRVVVEAPVLKEWYSVDEVATSLGKSKFTIREHCRFGRIAAVKRASGRGRTTEWAVSHAELTRFQNHGLLPLPLAEHDSNRL